MDIKELKEQKTKLEQDLHEVIRKRVEQFNADTDISVAGIDVSFRAYNTIGFDGSTHCVGEIRCTLDW